MAGARLKELRVDRNRSICGNFEASRAIIVCVWWRDFTAGDTSSGHVERHAECAEGAGTLRGVGKALLSCQFSEQVLRGKPLDRGHRATTERT